MSGLLFGNTTKGLETIVNPTRYTRMRTQGRARWGPVNAYACLSLILSLFLFVCISLCSAPHPKTNVSGLSLFTGVDSATLTNPNTITHHTPCTRCPRLAQIPGTTVMFARDLFAIAADTEANDFESIGLRAANPICFSPSCIAWAAWALTAARPMTVPLYLFHQSMLC